MKIYELLSDPKAWTQGVCARNHNGHSVHTDSPEAVSWCLSGAEIKCYKIKDWRVLNKMVDAIGSITGWNDYPNRTHAEVLALAKRLDI